MMLIAKSMTSQVERHLSGEQDTWQEAESSGSPGWRAGCGADPERGAGRDHRVVRPAGRDRGFGSGELLTGIAAAQLAGEDFLVGLDRQRADVTGQRITPVPGLASTTAAGLARRLTAAQWQMVETGLAAVTGRMLSL